MRDLFALADYDKSDETTDVFCHGAKPAAVCGDAKTASGLIVNRANLQTSTLAC
jgi:hypothetical protein